MNYQDELSETFADIAIIPSYSEVNSRSNVDITTDIGIKLPLPVISANMPDITGPKMVRAMYESGGLGIFHRFNTTDEAVKEYKAITKEWAVIQDESVKLKAGISIGVQPEDRERFIALYANGARVITIDVAHGHHKHVKNMLQFLNGFSGRKNIKIIAGNIATPEAAYDLAEWGADIVKVGIGPGSVCQTRQRTGVGIPQFNALKSIHEEIRRQGLKIKVIADGGMTSVGDIAKALIYADAVMVGAILAGTSETPGRVYPEPGTTLVDRRYYKMFGGSASLENKTKAGQSGKFVEGEMKKVPFKGHVKYILSEIREGLQSAFSYVGANNITEYREKVRYTYMTQSGRVESKI